MDFESESIGPARLRSIRAATRSIRIIGAERHFAFSCSYMRKHGALAPHKMRGRSGTAGRRASESPPLRLRLSHFPGKIVERTQLIAVRIGDPELAQAPRFILRLGDHLCPCTPPAMVQFVDLLPALEIQPHDGRSAVAVIFAEWRIRREHAALSLRDAPNPALFVASFANSMACAK